MVTIDRIVRTLLGTSSANDTTTHVQRAIRRHELHTDPNLFLEAITSFPDLVRGHYTETQISMLGDYFLETGIFPNIQRRDIRSERYRTAGFRAYDFVSTYNVERESHARIAYVGQAPPEVLATAVPDSVPRHEYV